MESQKLCKLTRRKLRSNQRGRRKHGNSCDHMTLVTPYAAACCPQDRINAYIYAMLNYIYIYCALTTLKKLN